MVLNSNCDIAGGCGPTSPQATWLAADLASHHQACTLAYWHHPRFSTGLHGSDSRTKALWQILTDHHADLVLAAHEHGYERFAPLAADGTPNAAGMASFVVGTGGQAVHPPTETTGEAGRRRQAGADGSEKRIDSTFGALLLDLNPTSYSYQFVTTTGAVADQGTGQCH